MHALLRNRTRHHDHLLLAGWLFAAPILSLLTSAQFGLSIVLFFGIPAVYLTLCYPRHAKRVAVFSLLVSIPLVTVLDYMMEVTGGMSITQSLFGSFRLFGYVPVESYVWGFFFLYLIALYYEIFLDHHILLRKVSTPRIKYLALSMFMLLCMFFFLYAFQPEVLVVRRYFYFIWGLLLVVIPVGIVLWRHPKLTSKFLRATAYFFFLLLGYEITAIHLGQWSFPDESQYLGIVSMVGARFPVEELFYFVLCGVLATLSYFEFFSDDRK